MKLHKGLIIILTVLMILYTCKGGNNFDIRQAHIEEVDNCYIYFIIEYKSSEYNVVCTVSELSGLIEKFIFKRNLTNSEFRIYLDSTLFNKNFIHINDTIYHYLKPLIVNPKLVQEYSKIDIIRKFSLKMYGKFPDTLDFENEKALTYLLLSKNLMRCCQDCETGITVLSEIDK